MHATAATILVDGSPMAVIYARLMTIDLTVEEVIGRLTAEAGVEIVEGVVIPPLVEPEMIAGSPDMVNAEFAHGMRTFFDRYTPDGPVMSLMDVVDWNLAHARANDILGNYLLPAVLLILSFTLFLAHIY
jgi:hypothetical protein